MKKKKRKTRREKTNPRLGKLVIEAVKEQLGANEPPETKLNFDRLIAEGYPEEEVYKMLANVLACEMFEVMKHNRPYNNEKYVNNLNNLPTLPSD
jgi:hypothetical protein